MLTETGTAVILLLLCIIGLIHTFWLWRIERKL